MKLQVFAIFVLTVGLSLVLALVVTAQGGKVGDVNWDVVTADSSVSLSSPRNATSLSHHSEITFTAAFTTYLPAIFKGYGACSTIPTLLSPANGSNLNTIAPLFRWDNGNNPSATTLRLQVAKDSGFTQSVRSLWSGGTSGVSEFRFTSNLDPATTYYWRAWLMCNDTQGPYSEVWSFTTGSDGTILAAPMLTAPANGSTLPSLPVTLQWSTVDGTVEYLLRWRKVGQGGYTYSWQTETQREFSWLEANTSYEWWVSARNDYAIGENSETWQFTTPAESSSMPPLDLNRFVVEDDVTTIFEERETK